MKKIGILGFFTLTNLCLMTQPTNADYTMAGTYIYTVPPGYNATIQVEAWGAGGGVVNGSGPTGGGGGGGYSRGTYSSVIGGADTIFITVGAGSLTGNNRQSNYRLNNGTIYRARGGGRGTTTAGGAGGTATAPAGGLAVTGGAGGAPGTSVGGGGGSAACSDGTPGMNGTDGDSGGNGGNAPCTGGANGGDGGDPMQPGAAGAIYGGGVGGRGQGFSGTNGLPGRGRVTVTVLSYLPIELTAFNGRVNEKAIELTWKTAAEINNHFIALERSANGKIFQEISRFEGKGDAHTIREYTFRDEFPFTGNNYYRLRQVDYDGTETFSNIINVPFQTGHIPENLQIRPNIAQQGTPIRIEPASDEEDIVYRLYNLAGNLIKTVQGKGGEPFILETSQLGQGWYMVETVNFPVSRSGMFFIKW